MEKASAFETKAPRRYLAQEMKNLDDTAKVKQTVMKTLRFIDFENKIMKNSGIKLTFIPNSQEEMIKSILKRKTKIAKSF